MMCASFIVSPTYARRAPTSIIFYPPLRPTLTHLMPPPDTRPDEALIAAMNAGGPTAEAAFATLYYRHKAWAANVAHRYTRDANLALDAMQDAFLYVIRRTPGLKLSCRFRTFLYPAIKHAALTLAKKHRCHPSLGGVYVDQARQLRDNAHPIPPLTSPSVHELRRADIRAELATALVALDDPQREILIMRIVDGMTTEEVALALHIPTGTVKSRLHHAIKKMREALNS